MPYPRMVDRSFFTRLKFYDALQEAIEVLPYRECTVDDLCHRAHRSKATFYRHFKNLDDVMRSHFRDLSRDSLAEIGRSLTFYEGNLLMTESLAEFLNLYASAVSTFENNFMSAVARDVSTSSFAAPIMEKAPDELDDELRFEIEAHSYAAPLMMARWITRGMEEPPSAMARQLDLCAPTRLRNLLNRLVERP